MLDDKTVNFSHIKNSIESIDSYDDAFIDDIAKLGFVGEALTEAFSNGNIVHIRKCNRSGWNDSYYEFVDDNGFVCFYLVSRSANGNEEQVAYPTSYNVNRDSYDDYSRYVDSIYGPISAFLDMWNEYNESDNNLFDETVLVLGMIVTGIFAIIYLIIVFLSIQYQWYGVLFFAYFV